MEKLSELVDSHKEAIEKLNGWLQSGLLTRYEHERVVRKEEEKYAREKAELFRTRLWQDADQGGSATLDDDMSPVQRRQRSCSSVSGTIDRKRPRREPHRYEPGEGSIARTSEYQASDALRRATAATLYAEDYLPPEWKKVEDTEKYAGTTLYVMPGVNGHASRGDLQEGEHFFVTAQEAVERSINDNLTKYTLERNVPMVFEAAATLRNYLTDQHALLQPKHVPEEFKKPKAPAPGKGSARKDPPSASRTEQSPRTDAERERRDGDHDRVPARSKGLSRLSKCSRTKSTRRKAQVSQAVPGSAAGAANRAAAAPPRRAQLEEDLDSATSESEEWEDSDEDDDDEEDDEDEED
jgi:hypothetical protein